MTRSLTVRLARILPAILARSAAVASFQAATKSVSLREDCRTVSTAGAAFTGNKEIVLPAESAVSFKLLQPVEIKM